jgi:hypothetical protein
MHVVSGLLNKHIYADFDDIAKLHMQLAKYVNADRLRHVGSPKNLRRRQRTENLAGSAARCIFWRRFRLVAAAEFGDHEV